MIKAKFRVWDKKNKYMDEIDGHNLYITNGKIYEVYMGSRYYDSYLEKEDVTDEYELMQYTGCEDKHGIEICEGDIVGCESDWNEDGYYESGRVFVLEDIRDIFLQLEGCECYEVIGNVYESQKLINEY